MSAFYFRLPPLGELTSHQKFAVDMTDPIALKGGPGTGKSVVSLYRHSNNIRNGIDSQLLTYTRTLAFYLKNCLPENAYHTVDSFFHWLRHDASSKDEIIIDEAQDLSLEQHNSIRCFSSRISYGADDSQILYPEHSSSEEELSELFVDSKTVLLSKNFRNSRRIMELSKKAFPEAIITNDSIEGISQIGEIPKLFITNNDEYSKTDDTQDKIIILLLDELSNSSTQNIAILVPWKKDVEYFHNIISKKYSDCSCFHGDNDNLSNISNIHITTFKSAKGLEFDTVIIPNLFRIVKLLSSQSNHYNVEWQDVYVAFTRARSSLFLISCKDLQVYGSSVERINMNDIPTKKIEPRKNKISYIEDDDEVPF